VAARCASEVPAAGSGLVPAAGSGLHLECAAAGAPAPYKRTVGEDAYFIQGNAAGVFDGVGGWSDRNVDAAVYSRYLAKFTAGGVRLRGPQGVAAALVDAAAATRVGGGSTAVVAGLVGDRLRGLNLGDSGLWVIRDGRVVYQSKRQQHAFNYRYQVSWGDTEVVEQAAPIDVHVRDGDWVVLARDGLFDNVSEKDLVGVMSDAMAGRGGGGGPFAPRATALRRGAASGPWTWRRRCWSARWRRRWPRTMRARLRWRPRSTGTMCGSRASPAMSLLLYFGVWEKGRETRVSCVSCCGLFFVGGEWRTGVILGLFLGVASLFLALCST